MEDLITYVNILHPNKFKKTMKSVVKKKDSTTTFVNVLIAVIFSTIIQIINVITSAQSREQLAQSVQGTEYEFLLTLTEMSSTPLGMAVTFVMEIGRASCRERV